jgi:enoyl-CoA hydratase/carnithine racemase
MQNPDDKRSEAQPVLYTIDGAVATVTLNRPERLNAVTPEMMATFFDYLAVADTDEAVRVVIVTGAGRGFCAGADTERLGQGSARTRRRTFRDQVEQTEFALNLRKPMLAAINGACAGAGLALALFCDVRFISEDAIVTTAFARRGLVAEYGVSWLLPRVIGVGNAMDLLLSGRTIRGREAHDLGLANWVYPQGELMERVVEYATELVERSSPRSMAGLKRQVYGHSEVDLASALAETIRLVDASLRSPDFAEGIASFAEKREPRFGPLGGTSAVEE